MSKKARDLIFIFFILFFIVLAIVISLFASGYKFNLSRPFNINRILQKTGSLIVSTSPKDAYIFIDGKQQKNPVFKLFKQDYLSTPNKVKNLLPGKYKLTLTKKNYWPLEKEVEIKSGIATIVENIHLFRSDLPIILIPSSESKISLSPSKDFLFLESDQAIYNLQTLEKEQDIESGEEIHSWSQDKNILVDALNIYNLENKTEQKLELYFDQEFKAWKYDRENDFLYYSLKSGGIGYLDINNRELRPLLNFNGQIDFKVSENNLYTISQIHERKYLLEYDINEKRERRRLELPPLGNYLFHEKNINGYLSLYDEQNLSLYLINRNNWQESYIINKVKDWDYIGNDRIIYHNGWEITLLDLDNGKSFLIARVSDEIKEIIWHDKEDYFLFTSEKGLHAGDLESKVITDLFNNDSINSLALDSSENALYFYAQIGQQSGVYKLIMK